MVGDGENLVAALKAACLLILYCVSEAEHLAVISRRTAADQSQGANDRSAFGRANRKLLL
jgi:hypothetical protein